MPVESADTDHCGRQGQDFRVAGKDGQAEVVALRAAQITAHHRRAGFLGAQECQDRPGINDRDVAGAHRLRFRPGARLRDLREDPPGGDRCTRWRRARRNPGVHLFRGLGKAASARRTDNAGRQEALFSRRQAADPGGPLSQARRAPRRGRRRRFQVRRSSRRERRGVRRGRRRPRRGWRGLRRARRRRRRGWRRPRRMRRRRCRARRGARRGRNRLRRERRGFRRGKKAGERAGR